MCFLQHSIYQNSHEKFPNSSSPSLFGLQATVLDSDGVFLCFDALRMSDYASLINIIYSFLKGLIKLPLWAFQLVKRLLITLDDLKNSHANPTTAHKNSLPLSSLEVLYHIKSSLAKLSSWFDIHMLGCKAHMLGF